MIISALDKDEKEELRVYRQLYKRQIGIYDHQKTALATLQIFIQQMIIWTYLTYTFKCKTPYDMLVALKQCITLIDQAQKIKLTNWYQKLKKAPYSQNLEAWFQQWETTYKEYKDLKLPDIEDDQPLYDFLHAISDFALEFANI